MNKKVDRKALAERLEEYSKKSGKTYKAIADEIGDGISTDTLRHLRKDYSCGEEKCKKIIWYLRREKLGQSEREHESATVAIEVEEESTLDAMIKVLQSKEKSANSEGMTALTHEAREIVTSMSEQTGKTYKECASTLIEYAAKILKSYGKVLMD